MISMLIQVFGAYVATVTAALVVEAPRYTINKAGWIGGMGYLVYLVVKPYSNAIVATLFASIVITIMGQIFARTFKAPVTIFYIPALFPLVPGIGIYKTAFYYINNNSNLSRHFFFETIMIAGAIALAIFIIDSVIEMYKFRQNKKDRPNIK
ncbi:threonine/serine exporter family protein [Vaginisenegalia massiliensis]|uniref:threonine/serine exporter family protein n=1 Tax=Vaginisenegalia massiliensis TaxID=2058294 RepID=UPI001F150CA1|nr:threonine/serine exporter family protein [Vaginisenegalia massiliensis]